MFPGSAISKPGKSSCWCPTREKSFAEGTIYSYTNSENLIPTLLHQEEVVYSQHCLHLLSFFPFFQPCCSFSSSISFSSNALKLFICVHFSRQSSSPESPSTSSGRRKVHLPSNQGRGAAKQSSMGRKIVRGFEDFQRNKSDPLAGLSARILNKNRKRDVAGIKKKRNFQRKSSHKWL